MQFDEYADTYADDVQRAIAFGGQELEFYTRRKVDHLLDVTRRLVGNPQQCSMLDVGCGIGQTDALLAPHVGALHGVDVATESIEHARRTNATVTYRSYDGVTLPYADASVDVAFAICVAHHVEPPARPAFVSELRRVVRPAGLVVLFEHNPYNPLTRRVVRNCPFDEGVVLLSRRTSHGLLVAGGLTPVEARYIIFTPVDNRAITRCENRLGWLPLGAQHYVAARR
jgi:SAM-dependent methyltransferase